MYLHKKRNTMYLVFILYCETHLLLLSWDMGKVGTGLVAMGRFKVGLRCKLWVNSLIINGIT